MDGRLILFLGLLTAVAGISGCAHSKSETSGPTTKTGTASVQSNQPDAPNPTAAKPPFVRPMLAVQQGQYFSYAMPSGWKASETANGVDMTSPDGKLIASSALLVGTPGSATPWSFVKNVLTQIGAHDIKLLHSKDLPSQKSGYPGISWTIQGLEVTCTDKEGSARHTEWTCGICNAYGSYSAILQTFSSPEADFDQAKTWMPLLAESVKVTNPSKVAYQDTIIPAQNHPLDNSALMKSWEYRRQSQDRIMQKQHETTMGYERMVSPIDGRHYNAPFEAYDGTVGGYRDPADHLAILKHAAPGE